MTIAELIDELQQFDPELPVCWVDANDEYLYPCLCGPPALVNGPWCDGPTAALLPHNNDHNSEHVEIGW